MTDAAGQPAPLWGSTPPGAAHLPPFTPCPCVRVRQAIFFLGKSVWQAPIFFWQGGTHGTRVAHAGTGIVVIRCHAGTAPCYTVAACDAMPLTVGD